MAAKTWSRVAGTINWSDATNWNGGTVPVTTDAITFDVTSVLNCNVNALGTWASGTFTIAASYTGTIAIQSGIAMTTAAFTQNAGTFNGDAAGSAAFTTATIIISGGTFDFTNAGLLTTDTCLLNGTGSIKAPLAWTCRYNWTVSGGTTSFTHNNGTITFDGSVGGGTLTNTTSSFFKIVVNSPTQGFGVAAGTTAPFGTDPSSIVSPTIQLNGTVTWSGTWSITGNLGLNSGATISGGTNIIVTDGSYTINSGATIAAAFNVTMNITSSTSRFFISGGKTYGNFRRTGAGSGQITFIDAVIFAGFQDNDGSVAHTLVFTISTTYTISSWSVSGVSGLLVTIISSSAGTAATIHTTGGQVSGDYLSIKDSTVDASPGWYAGANSTNVSGNTNWIFTAAPAGVAYTGRRGRNRQISSTSKLGRRMRVRQSA